MGDVIALVEKRNADELEFDAATCLAADSDSDFILDSIYYQSLSADAKWILLMIISEPIDLQSLWLSGKYKELIVQLFKDYAASGHNKRSTLINRIFKELKGFLKNITNLGDFCDIVNADAGIIHKNALLTKRRKRKMAAKQPTMPQCREAAKAIGVKVIGKSKDDLVIAICKALEEKDAAGEINQEDNASLYTFYNDYNPFEDDGGGEPDDKGKGKGKGKGKKKAEPKKQTAAEKKKADKKAEIEEAKAKKAADKKKNAATKGKKRSGPAAWEVVVECLKKKKKGMSLPDLTAAVEEKMDKEINVRNTIIYCNTKKGQTIEKKGDNYIIK